VNHQDRMDGSPDPILAAAMAELRDEVDYQVDWDQLQSSIQDRAVLHLARRRSRGRSVVARRFVPIALAASIAFALWAGPSLYQDLVDLGLRTQIAADIDQEDILMQALGGDLSEQEFRNLVSGRANPELLLAVAVGAR
jgi:hypothetical protein